MAASARQQIDITPELREMGAAAAFGVGCGSGVGQMAGGILELSPRRFFGGLLMVFVTCSLAVGYVFGEELRLQEERNG